MKTISVNASKKYDIYIGSGIYSLSADYICDNIRFEKALIVCDENVDKLYSDILITGLIEKNKAVSKYVFYPDERSKSFDTINQICEYAAEYQFSKSDIFIALGGGVTGDITGFAACVYLRGISYIQIPTTLLAAVDSSVGGKTAVNLRGGKNLVGAIYQPSLVLSDTNFFKTLPNDIFIDGLCECIKYAVGFDDNLFSLLLSSDSLYMEEIVYRCIDIKRIIVEEDEFDNNSRMLLNFGHTIGHAVEKCSDFKIGHGHSVAIGIHAITKTAVANGLCSAAVYENVLKLMKKYDISYELPYKICELIKYILLDKKIKNGNINLIIPIGIGKLKIINIPVEQLENFLTAGGGI